MGSVKLIGIDAQLRKIKEWLEDWGNGKKGLILHGPPGTGKTSSAYRVAGEVGCAVVEFNASDERGKEFMRRLRKVALSSSLFSKAVILLDEADGIEDKAGLASVIRDTKKPIILTANDVRSLGARVREECAEVAFFRPKMRDVVRHVREMGEETGDRPEYGGLMRDFRQAELAAFQGSQGYRPCVGRVSRLEQSLKSGEFAGRADPTDLIHLLDNSGKLFYGRRLLDFVRAIAVSDYCGRMEPLCGFRSNGKLDESHFLRKLEVLRSGRGA